MNPNENNPISPADTGGVAGGAPAPGGASVPSALDFTNPANLDNGVSGLAGNSGAAATNIDGTATTTPPMPPLTPAEPVPGSIGSVTSVPPLAPEPMDMSALNNGAAASSNMPVMGQAPESKPAAPAQPYYNPFTRNNVGGSAPESTAPATSSSTVPPALQPQTEKFSDRLKETVSDKKPHSIMPLLGWLLALLFAVAAVIFAILWQTAEGKEKIVYYPSPDAGNEDEPGEDEGEEPPVEVIAAVSCTQDLGADPIEGLEGLTSRNRTVRANYNEGNLADILMATNYTFVDSAAAEGARGYFDGENNAYAQMGETLGIAPLAVGYEIADNVLTYNLAAAPDKLVGEYADRFMLPKNEDGTLKTDAEAVKGALEAVGMTCATE